MIVLDKKAKLVIALLALCAQMFFGSQFVSADLNEGPGGGSGGGSGCSGIWSTCRGSSWRYYTTNSDSVTIPAGGSTGSAPGGTITGCKAAGGYWRYAFERTNGVQVGIGEIGGETHRISTGSLAYRSEFLSGGRMNYYDIGAVDSGLNPWTYEGARAKLSDAIKNGRGSSGIITSYKLAKGMRPVILQLISFPPDIHGWLIHG